MEIGARIKQQYQVIEHIGRGGMADVWSARDMRLRRMVAIKTIAAGLSSDTDFVALFEKEAQTIAQMEHPHILPIYDFGEYDNSLFIVMRYMSSGSLEDILTGGAMPVDDVLKMGEAVARALDYAHENSVIHLDLKPPNILLDSTGVPYLADFGLATVLDRNGRARNPGSGTLLYMAPEQLTSETIDHRADIYSFCIMLYHMLAGELPLEGTASLALRQVQIGDRLGLLSEHVDLPDSISDILREGTSLQPNNRPDTHIEIIERIREILEPTSIDIAFAPYADVSGNPVDEAHLMYNRALNAWQGGNGRFLLGVTHYMLMSDAYQYAMDNDLSISREGYQMLLRGAIEYDYQLKYWWSHRLATPDDQRWVCLHAVRSGNTGARIRAFNYLEHLAEQHGDPIIPNLVAQALEVERDMDAKLAALRVLEKRIHDVEHYQFNIDVDKLKHGTIASISRTFTNLGIQLTDESIWHEIVYSKDIDTLIAETAFDTIPEVAEYAARVIGRIHSLTAVRYLAQAQDDNRHGALDALAYVRDETSSLPNVVNPQARSYAWITNTVRRLAENPVDLMQRMLILFLFGTLAMGEQIFALFRSNSFFAPERWGNTLGIGILFGVFITLTYVVSDIFSRRLAGFWLWWQRLLLTFVLGFGLALLSYGGYTWMFYRYTPDWEMMRFAAMGLVFAFALTALLDLKRWQGALFTFICAYYPVLTIHLAHYHIQETSIAHVPLVAFVLGTFVGVRTSHQSPITANLRIQIDRRIQATIAGVVGIASAVLLWLVFIQWLQSSRVITWDTVSLLFLSVFLLSTLAMYWLSSGNRVALFVGAVGAFVGLSALLSWYTLDLQYTVPDIAGQDVLTITYFDGVPLNPNTHLNALDRQPFIHYDDYSFILTVTVPLFLTVAIAAHFLSFLAGWWQFIGRPNIVKERGNWLSSVLIFVMIGTALLSVVSLFTIKDGMVWALLLSLWGFITFVFALAAYRWAKWGAIGLIVSSMLLVVGGFIADVRHGASAYSVGEVPQYFSRISFTMFSQTIAINYLVIWSLWALMLGFLAWGAIRQKLWAGIGIISMIALWFGLSIFTQLHGSIAIISLSLAILVLFALHGSFDKFEANRFQMPQLRQTITQIPTMPPTVDTMPESIVTNPSDLVTEYDPAVNRTEEDQPTELKVRDNLRPKMKTLLAPDVTEARNAKFTEPETEDGFLPDTDTIINVADTLDLPTEEAEKPIFKINTANVRTKPADEAKPSISIKTDSLRTERKTDLQNEDKEDDEE